jgi:type IV pilus assembly protein PilQ
MVLAAQPANATTQITNVQITPAATGVNVMLQTQGSDRPQVFTVNRGKAVIADIINTQLRLPEGNGFLQNNPAPGISMVTVAQLDGNSVRVTVSGETAAPTGQVSQDRQGLTLSVSQDSAAAPASDAPVADVPEPPITVAQAAQPSQPRLRTEVPLPTGMPVMVPNPGLSVDGIPVSQQPDQPAPTAPRRAIAPPLGDISVSPIDASPAEIDLGTTEIVPRLVLRDAPVRDVLSLLARAAGMNVAFVNNQVPAAGATGAAGAGAASDQAGAAAQAGQAGQSPPEIKVSLDIENEPVQEVFNYVLRVAGLEANRSGRTIFIGPRLPDEARDMIARTLRLNQVTSSDAAGFLTTQGAETQVARERIEIQTFGEGAAARTVEVRTPEILALRAASGQGPLLLQGLTVSTNDRLNSITLVGPPRKVQIATELLAQLDLRRRQVAVNVKIVDVNLLATNSASTSFSFGAGDTFVSSDGGAAVLNFGGTRPPSTSDVTGSRLSPPITAAPFPDGVEDLGPFQDAQPDAPFGTGSPQTFSNPSLNDGTIRTPGGTFVRPPFGTEDNPLQGGVTDIQENRVEVGLPQLFQYPTRFLASLQAQVTSGNAKILTDPTLTVQEGQTARVRLTQQVYSGIRGTGVGEFEPIISDAGLSLEVVVDRIDDNGFVTLAINPTVAVPGATVEGPESQGNITLLQQRSLQSGRIRLRDGQTLILAGIIQESDRATVRKVPLLGDLPLIGALFRSTERNNQRQEVIVLVTPQVLEDSDFSDFGYRYTPGPEAQQLLQQRGVAVP